MAAEVEWGREQNVARPVPAFFPPPAPFAFKFNENTPGRDCVTPPLSNDLLFCQLYTFLEPCFGFFGQQGVIIVHR